MTIARLRELLAAANDPHSAEEYFPAVRSLFEALPALLDVVEAAKAMREAFGKHQGYWPQMGWTPVEFDAALKRLEGGDKP